MNSAIERLKKGAWAQMPDRLKKDVVILDTDSDEDKVAKLLNHYGSDFVTTRKERGVYCRWDVEGKTLDGTEAIVEVKSRTYGGDFATWIIDAYKIDFLLKKFPDSNVYFVNVFQDEIKVFNARYVADCEIVKKWAKFKDGKQEMRTCYDVPKNDFIVELISGEYGDQIENNEIWIKDEKK